MRTLIVFSAIFLSCLLALTSEGTPPYYAQQKVINQDKVIVKEKLVEFDADTYLGLGGYYSVQENLAQKHDTGALLQKQSEQIDALIRLLEAKYKGEVKPTVPAPIEPPVVVTPPPGEPTPVVPQVPTAGLNAQVYQIFKTNCVNCHGPNQASGKLQLIGRDAQGDYLVDVGIRAFKVYDRTAGIRLAERKLKLMPIGGTALSDEDVSTIWLWAMANYKEVN